MERIWSMILIVILLFTSAFSVNDEVHGKELKKSFSDICIEKGNRKLIIKAKSSGDNLINAKKRGVLYQKLKNDKNQHVTTLSAEVEEGLNSAGMRDEVINNLSEEALNEFENAELIIVDVGYYGIDESGEAHELDEDSTDEIINECIQNDTIKMEDGLENDNYLKHISRFLGITPTNTYAGYTWKSDTEKSPSGALERTMTITQGTKGGDLHITNQDVWIKEAKYKNKDITGISVNGMKLIAGADYRKCTHKATYSKYQWNAKKEKVEIVYGSKKTNPTAYTFNAVGVLCYTVNLFGNRNTLDKNYVNKSGIYKYTNETIIVEGYALGKSLSKSCVVSDSYLHCETSIDVSTQVTVDANGPSFSVTYEFKKYYRNIKNSAGKTFCPYI